MGVRALADRKAGGSMSSIPKTVTEAAPQGYNTSERRKRSTSQNARTKRVERKPVVKKEKSQTKQKSDSASLKKLFKL